MSEIKYDDLIKALKLCAAGECYLVPDADGIPTCGCDGISGQAADAITALIARAEKAEAERDAAIADVPHECYTCAHQITDEVCAIGSKDNCFWKWKGATQC